MDTIMKNPTIPHNKSKYKVSQKFFKYNRFPLTLLRSSYLDRAGWRKFIKETCYTILLCSIRIFKIAYILLDTIYHPGIGKLSIFLQDRAVKIKKK